MLQEDFLLTHDADLGLKVFLIKFKVDNDKYCDILHIFIFQKITTIKTNKYRKSLSLLLVIYLLSKIQNFLQKVKNPTSAKYVYSAQHRLIFN